MRDGLNVADDSNCFVEIDDLLGFRQCDCSC